MKRFRRIQISILILVLCFLLHKLPLSRQILHILRLKTYDLVLDFSNAFQENDDKPKIDDIVIIDIDEYSIATLGQYSTWPNLYFADLIDSLSKDSPAAIGFDIFFPEADSINSFGRQRLTTHLKSKGYEAGKLFEHYTSDAELAAAIRRAGNVYLAMFDTKEEVGNDNITDALKGWEITSIKAVPVENPKAPIPILGEAARGVGFAQIDTDISGLIHDYPFFFKWEDQVFVNYSFQVVLDLLQIDEIKNEGALNLYSEGKLIRKLPLYDEDSIFISYYGKPRRFRYIPFSHVLMGLVSEGFFKDKIVLIGSSTVGLRDIKPSPLGRDFPGVELHATVMQNILREDFVHWTPDWLNWLISALLIVFISLSIRHLKPHQSLLLFLGSSALLGLIFLLLFYWVVKPKSIPPCLEPILCI
ncbi:MAG: CHASE2 domain-containing protein [Candidatus Cloacimonetes bacterium]|nr:CHASE2 domain-containing protein [Candidatus Cloacimonadota bacterium]